MRILVISNMYPSEKDKVYGTFVKEFFDGLSAKGHDASLIAIKGKGKGPFYKIIKYIKFYTDIIISVIIHRYDLIYVHTISHTSPPLLLASKLKKLNNIVFNIHGDDLLTTSNLALRLRNMAIPLLKNAAMIVVPTQYFKDVLQREFNWIDRTKIAISPSGGLNKRFFVESKENMNRIPKLGYVSRIDEGKGWETLLDAVKKITSLNVNLELVMVGSGKQEDELKAKIKDLELENIVSFIGPLTHKQLPEFYSSLNWFIFPSYRDGESLGLVGLEAMAAHTPVIGSNMAGLRSYIRDGYNGYFFEPKNSSDLAEVIIRALSISKDQKEIYNENAYNTAIPYESSKVNDSLFIRLEQLLLNH